MLRRAEADYKNRCAHRFPANQVKVNMITKAGQIGIDSETNKMTVRVGLTYSTFEHVVFLVSVAQRLCNGGGQCFCDQRSLVLSVPNRVAQSLPNWLVSATFSPFVT